MIKLNLSKDFDRVNEICLRLILLQIGISLSFINWIEGCLSSSFFSVPVNRSSSQFFKPTKGLREEYPLSPMLFLIVAKWLCRLFGSLKKSERLKGIKIGR
jgi:hypothetical protein